MRRFLGARLHRGLFVWSGVAILLTLIAAGVVTKAFGFHPPWRPDAVKAEHFAADRFARVWNSPSERSDLGRGLSDAFDVSLSLYDTDRRLLERHGAECHRAMITLDVVRSGQVVGQVVGCMRSSRHRSWPFWLGLAAAGSTLWLLAGWFAHRLTTPLRDLTRVTREIGDGKLSSRARLAHQHPGEVGELARSVNEMAGRIEKQIDDQKELLAAVSHEVRTPLARMRVLSELLREQGAEEEHLAKLEREVAEVDGLTGQLLARSRLDFDDVQLGELVASGAAALALERASLPSDLLVDKSEGAKIMADPTLLARGLANLLSNAERHGGGLLHLELYRAGRSVVFDVRDGGKGFDSQILPRAFESFAHGRDDDDGSPSLGLGLALVKRIALAHRGDVEASNLEGGGASVRLSVPAIEDA